MQTTERRIGRYVLLEPVGRGAMGVVYRAEDPDIHRTVAVKVLHTRHGLTQQEVDMARERFSREGQAAGGIDHPNIIRVFDVGEDDTTHEMYIVMEFVSGPDLEAELREGIPDLDRAGRLIGQISAGLDAAHARGIVHRDIKPSNILLTSDGTAKIADFGITRIAASALTQDMREIGTPAYMSPEQVHGKDLDSKADLFSLGVLSYELLAGRKPFAGTDIVSTAHAIAYDAPVPISKANPVLPPALDAIFERMLAKEPSERFGSGREFYESLILGLSPNPAERGPARTSVAVKRPYAVWGIVGAVALVALMALLAFRPRTEPPPPEPVARPASVAKIVEPPQPKSRPSATTRKPNPVKKPPPRKPEPKAAEASVPTPKVETASAAPKTVAPAPRPSATKAAPVVAPVPTATLTIRFAHRIRRGTLIVLLDSEPIFEEKFAKTKLALVQTTVWDPLQVPAGGHSLRARVQTEDGKTYESPFFAVELSQDHGVELRIGQKGDALTIKPTAQSVKPTDE